MKKYPNILFFGIDSLRSDHMSLYGYDRLTTPHIDRYFEDGGITFDKMYSASIPTTPGYASMLTGMDCFATDCVALRHEGALTDAVRTLPEILRDYGYTSTYVGGHACRGCDTYLTYRDWNPDKAEELNKVAIPELERLAAQDKPWVLFMRHMDPHSPYYTKEPFTRMFYQGDEFDPNNKSLKALYEFKPFRDYFLSWFPEGCTDAKFICAQYDSSVAYMDVCINQILEKLKELGLEEETIVVFTSDHGETLDEHDCYFDHHSIHDNVLNVPFMFKYAPFGYEGHIDSITQVKDITPTILSLCGIDCGIKFDGRDMTKLIKGEEGFYEEPEFYITECTWMRKHGWRTPEWKLIVALEPDFHFKPEVELYNLIKDPKENNNVAEEYPEVVEFLRNRMEAHIAKREKEVGHANPMYTNPRWSGEIDRPFASSEEAYNTLHIGDPEAAQKLQDKLHDMGITD